MVERLRVLLVMGESTGGIGRHVASLAEELPRHGVDVTVCGPDASLRRLGVERTGATIAAAPVGAARPGDLAAALRAVRRHSGDAHVVHAHGLRAGVVAVSASGRPTLLTWHNAATGNGVGRLGHRLAERYAARRAARTLVVSADLAERARRYGGRGVRTTFVPAPALPAAQTSADEVRSRLGLAGHPLVLAVGRLEPQKRFDVLIDAARRWAAGPGAPVVAIAGDGSLRAALADRIALTGAPVRLLGPRKDVADLLGAATLVAVSSDWEGCPLIVQEALRVGVPLVSTRVGGIPAMVGDAAVLVPPADPPALARGCESLLFEPQKRDRLTAGGPGRAAQWPDLHQVVSELVQDYLKVHRSVSRRGG